MAVSMHKQLLAMLSLAFMLHTATCTARGRSLFQADTTSAEGPGGGLFGGLLNGMGSGMGNGMGLGLLDRLDASTLGWDDITFGRATEQLNEWLAEVQTSALTALQDRPLAGTLLSEGGASEEGGLLGMLGLGGANFGSGGVLQQMAQSVQDSNTDQGSSGGFLNGGGGFLNGGGPLLGGRSPLLGGDDSLVERMRSAFGASDDGLLQQLMGGGNAGALGAFGSMFQNAGYTSSGSNREGAGQGSLAARYYNKAGN